MRATNRNFPGCLGHKDTQVCLAFPATVAATARRGKISDARGFGSKG
jgi:3-isopropylmalate/(R)-2-methylmalate dehydratase large subunit